MNRATQGAAQKHPAKPGKLDLANPASQPRAKIASPPCREEARADFRPSDGPLLKGDRKVMADPDRLIARALEVLRTGIVPDDVHLTPVQYAVQLDAAAQYELRKAEGADPLLIELSLVVFGAMTEVRRGKQPDLTKPSVITTGPAIGTLQRRAMAVIAIALIKETGKTFPEAADEVVGQMGNEERAGRTALGWREQFLSDPSRETELARFYDSVKAGLPEGETLPEKINRLLAIWSSNAVFKA
jgi:hypothetical protein